MVEDEDEGDEEEEDDELGNNQGEAGDHFISSDETISEIIADVDSLHENKIVDDTVKEHVRKLKTSLLFTKDD